MKIILQMIVNRLATQQLDCLTPATTAILINKIYNDSYLDKKLTHFMVELFLIQFI